VTSLTSIKASDLSAFIQTWSDFHRCKAANESEADQVLNQFNSEVKSIFDGQVLGDIELSLEFVHFLLMGRKM
jgi:hypothetical protein